MIGSITRSLQNILNSVKQFVRAMSRRERTLLILVVISTLLGVSGIIHNMIQDKNSLRFVAGTLRYGSEDDTWTLLDDSSHRPQNIKKVTTDHNRINIYYGFRAKKVISLIAVPDETFMSKGLSIGTSVGVAQASIYIKQNQFIGGLVGFDGDWFVPEGFIASFKEGILTVKHINMGEGTQVSATSTNDLRVSIIKTGPNYVQLSWYGPDGKVVEQPNSKMQAYLSRNRDSSKYIDPMTLRSNNGNIWVLGIFE